MYLDTTTINPQTQTQAPASSTKFNIGDISTGLLSPITSLIGGIFNYQAAKKTNESNQKINKQNLDYNAAMTQKQWERDDTAHQREVADLEAAGLSPLASIGGLGNSQALGAPNPIAMQAPQLDLNMLVQSMLQNKALDETKRHNLVQEGQTNIQLKQQADELKIKADQLKLDNRKLNEQIDYNAQYLQHLADQLSEVNRSNQKQEELKKIQFMSERFYKEINAQTHGKFNYKVYKDLEAYEAAMIDWSNAFDAFITQFLNETSETTSNSYSKGYSGGLNVGGSSGPSNIGVGGNISDTESSSGSYSYNLSKQQEAQMLKFYHDHPMPVYIWFEY